MNSSNTPNTVTSPSADKKNRSRQLLLWMDTVGRDDLGLVGGKNASLGEMLSELGGAGVRVPEGFAITAEAYRLFIRHNDLEPRIRELLSKGEGGGAIRDLICASEFPAELEAAITNAYAELSGMSGAEATDVAVRSSATAEDLPGASFAGQHETFLGVRGTQQVLHYCRRCFASLFSDRAISYREQKGFEHMSIALSVGVQKMVRPDLGDGVSGVMFTLDTETGFPDMMVINATYGLGETIVQGIVDPDEYRVFKPLVGVSDKRPIVEKLLGRKEIRMTYGQQVTEQVVTGDTPAKMRSRFALSDEQILQLSQWAKLIEGHYGCPMDLEWAVDGQSEELFILQARPETVHSEKTGGEFVSSHLLAKDPQLITSGLAVGNTIASGEAVFVASIEEADAFEEGQILITSNTGPDWVRVMRKAAGIVTDHGGRTSHAAIVSRELGVPAVVGTGDATERINSGSELTIDCSGGERGMVYEGILEHEEVKIDLESLPKTRHKLMLNIATPEAAFRWWQLPADGIGLARMEFIISRLIKIHPMALLHPEGLRDDTVREIDRLTSHYDDKAEFFVDTLARAMAHIASSCYPKPVIVRTSDFKTNEYAELLGGYLFEGEEANPMLGFRGASRYYSDEYREAFELECRAIRKAREEIGMANIIVMIPFCRTLEEADQVLEVMANSGLKRGEKGLEVYVMAEIPSNIVLASEFADRFDGFSIGSNDLTQLVLGVDRDSEKLRHLFDERNPAVKAMVSQLITAAHAKGRKVGICGQGPSDHPDFAEFLVEQGIDTISLTPDSLVGVRKRIAALEERDRILIELE